jgi:hypothetical protein
MRRRASIAGPGNAMMARITHALVVAAVLAARLQQARDRHSLLRHRSP